jgi:uncharacterized protein YndB with AHSA1/START domain
MAETTNSSAAVEVRQELVLTRILGAPCSLVFRTWTDPKQHGPLVGPSQVHQPRLTNSTCAPAG